MAATVLEALKSITAYPVPLRTLVETAERRGQSYSFTDEQRTEFKNRAYKLFNEFEDEAVKPKPIYGYKGSRL